MHLVDLTLLYGPQSGGVRTYLTEKRRWIAKRTRIRHTLIVPRQSRAPRDRSIVGIHSVPIPFGSSYRMPVGRVSPILRRLDPDVIEVEDPYHYAWSALRVGKQCRVPVIGFYHSDLPRVLGRRLGERVRRHACRYVADLYARFDLVLAPSMAMVEQLRELGVRRVRWQPLGVDTQTFHPDRRGERLRTQLGLPDDARLLVYAGRFSPEKNLPLLFEAMKCLDSRYHLLLVGGGSRVPKAPNVSCIGFQAGRERLAALIASSDVFVHPGDQETFGLAVLEAMACGVPVVGMRAGGVAELIDGATGALVQPGDAAGFARAVEELFERSPRRVGAAAREKVERHYGWDRAIQLLIGHYGQVCSLPRADTPGLATLHAAE